MKLSVFTDEINPSLPRALQLVKEWDLSHIEIRTVMDGRFPRLGDAELADLVKCVKEAGLAVSAVSPGYFKCLIDDAEIEAGISEGLPRACEWALKLGTSSVSSFAFRRSEGEMPTEQVVDYLGRMADAVGSAGCRMLLENEAACWGGTGLEAADLIRQVGPQRLGLCWDPGNSTRAGGDPSAEFEQIRSLIEHIHLKNYDPVEGRWSVLDSGVVDWPGIMELLRDIDYQGFLILETHTDISLEEFAPLAGQLDGKEGNTLHNLKYLRELLDGS
jgi:sugar phosphate isomerase/epimerase